MADASKQTTERVDGPTPNGGAYAIAHYRDQHGRPCAKTDAHATEIVEHAADGRELHRTYMQRD